MYKRIFVALLFSCITFLLSAQSGLVIQGTSADLHLQHTVAAKENWYSVGRMYNISPKEIAPFNAMTLESPLNIGQQLKIPLTASNFAQNESRAEDETYVPIYHTVQEKEWMYRISTTYNKVPVENLEKWNNISKDQIKAGMQLIIGYLKVKKDQSALVDRGAASTKPASPVATRPEEQKTVTVAKQDKPETTAVPREEKTTEVSKPQEEKTPTGTAVTLPVNKPVDGGYFRSLYEETGKNSSGSAGVFKSTSGWQDGKYYALMNGVAIGTIVKVSNPSNNKTVYAKVLGQLPDMKESAGLTVRISDAAASDLGANVSKFSVEVKY